MTRLTTYITLLMLSLSAAAVLASCDDSDTPAPAGSSAPEGMVEVRPVLSGVYNMLQRDPGHASRTYEDDATTNDRLINNKKVPLPEGSTVWLIAKNGGKLVKNSYVVSNSGEDDINAKSYLTPCVVDDDGNMTSIEGSPLYLKVDRTYEFYAISPARKLDDELFAKGEIGFKIKNGEYFYATDCRYDETSPGSVTISSLDTAEGVQEIVLKPMINQTAQLKFMITPGDCVHDLDMQPTGVYISGLQNDSQVSSPYGDSDGIQWKMAQQEGVNPITLQHGSKSGTYSEYDYTVDALKNIHINVGVVPMYSIPKPIIVLFRAKVNGVPTSYEMMLNEKDFKAGYSYEYRGLVTIQNGVDVISWQFLGWSTNVDFPFE